MRSLKRSFPLVLFFIIAYALGTVQAQDLSDNPKYLKLVDLTKCNMKITAIEHSKGVTSEEGEKITPSRIDAKLLLVKLEGVAYDFGRLSYNPGLFGVNYIYKGSLTFVPARAIGLRGKTPDGKKFEVWKSNPKVSFNSLVESKGEKINIWVAVEIPKAVNEFYVRIPADVAGTDKVKLK